MHQIQIPNPAVQYILFQRTNYLKVAEARLLSRVRPYLPRSFYKRTVLLEALFRGQRIKQLYSDDMYREYEILRPHLPASCAHVLDIGCGVAGIDVLLSRHYAALAPIFALLDKTAVSDNVYYGFETRGAFYNSLAIAKDLLALNGVPEERVTLLEARDDGTIPVKQPVDLAISMISWGYHYPVVTYLEEVKKALSPEGVLILDVRRESAEISLLQSAFRHCDAIYSDAKRLRLRCAR